MVAESELDADVTHAGILSTYKSVCDENALTEEEVLEIIEKRFGRALPLDCINVVLQMELH